MRAIAAVLTLMALVAGCMAYTPANLPLELDPARRMQANDDLDQIARSTRGSEADGPEYRITMGIGSQFFMKSPRIVGDSVIGLYRPQKGTPWARVAVPLYDVRLAERQRIDWLATSSLLVAPITLFLLLTE